MNFVQKHFVQGIERYIDFRIMSGKNGQIELKLSEQGFEEHDKDWKKTKMELNLWNEDLGVFFIIRTCQFTSIESLRLAKVFRPPGLRHELNMSIITLT